jgi:hypothetical protein
VSCYALEQRTVNGMVVFMVIGMAATGVATLAACIWLGWFLFSHLRWVS